MKLNVVYRIRTKFGHSDNPVLKKPGLDKLGLSGFNSGPGSGINLFIYSSRCPDPVLSGLGFLPPLGLGKRQERRRDKGQRKGRNERRE